MALLISVYGSLKGINRLRDTKFSLNQLINVESSKQGFLDGSVVKNLPTNAEDMGLIPSPGRYHMPQSSSAHVPLL